MILCQDLDHTFHAFYSSVSGPTFGPNWQSAGPIAHHRALAGTLNPVPWLFDTSCPI